VHHRGSRGLAEAMPLLEGAVTIGDTVPEHRTVIVEIRS
jgi:hypothetical protein